MDMEIDTTAVDATYRSSITMRPGPPTPAPKRVVLGTPGGWEVNKWEHRYCCDGVSLSFPDTLFQGTKKQCREYCRENKIRCGLRPEPDEWYGEDLHLGYAIEKILES